MSSSSLISAAFQQRRNSRWALSRRTLAIAAMMACGSLIAQAATLQWDPSSGDGNGVWDDATANWHDGTGSVIWQAGDVAEFSGTGGTVSLGLPVNVGGFNFLGGNYNLNGQGHLISLANASSTELNVTAGRVVIDAALSGTGALQKTGDGTLALKSEQFYAGTIVSGGTLELSDISILKPHVETVPDPEASYRQLQLSYLIKLNGTAENGSVLVVSQDTTLVGKDYDGNQWSDNRILVEGAGTISVNRGVTLTIRDFQKASTSSAPVSISGTLKISGDGDVVFEDNGYSIIAPSGSSVEINTTGKVSFIRCQERNVNGGPITGTVKVTRGTIYFEQTSMMNINGRLELKSEDVLNPSVLSGEGGFLLVNSIFENAILEPVRTGDHTGSGYLMIRNFSSDGSGMRDTPTNLINMTIRGKDGCINTAYSTFPQETGSLIFNIKGTLTAEIDNVGYLSPTENTVTIMAPLAGDGDLLKKGLGTLLLNGANTYIGRTILNTGTLIGNVPEDSAFTIAAGATYFSGDSTREYADPQDRRFTSLNGAGLVDMKGKNLGIGEGNFSTGTIQNTATLTKISNGTGEGGWFSVGNVLVADVSVEAGALEVSSERQLSVSNTLTVSDGATLAVTANTTKPSVLAREMVIGVAGTTLDISGYTSNTPVTLIRTQEGIQGNFSRITIGGQSLSSVITLGTFASAVVQKSSDNKSLEASVGLVWNNTSPDSAHGTFNVDSGSFTVDSSLGNNDAAASGDAGRAFGWDGKSLTKTGTGTLVLAKNNTYTGTTLVSQGTLQLGDGTDIVSANGGAVSGPIVNHASLIVNRGSYWNYENVLSGSGDLIKQGTGVFGLSGGGTYHGAVYVTSGALHNRDSTLAKSLTLSDGSVWNGENGIVAGRFSQKGGSAINCGLSEGELDIERGKFTQAGSIVGPIVVGQYGEVAQISGVIEGDVHNQGKFSINSISSSGGRVSMRVSDAENIYLEFNGSPSVIKSDFHNESTGTLNIWRGRIEGTIYNSGKLNFYASGTGSMSSYDGDIENDGNIFIENESTFTISSAISGGGSLEKVAVGKLILKGVNTYTGTTEIKAGILEASVANVFAQSSRVAVASGAIFDLNKNNQAVQSLDMQGGIIRLGPEYPKPSTGGGTSSGASGTIVISGSSGASLKFEIPSIESGSLKLSGTGFSGISLGAVTVDFSMNGSSTNYQFVDALVLMNSTSQQAQYRTWAENTDLALEQFTTLKVGHLSGTGNFQFRANFLSGGYDQLIVTNSASGQHLVDVSFLYDAESLANKAVELVHIDDPNSTATFALRYGPLSGGLRAYTLARGSTLGSGYSDSSYYFTNLNDALSATGSVVVATSVDSALLWLTQLDNLHKRMGELRLGGTRDMASWDTWVRGYAQQVNMKAEVTGLAYKSYMYGGDVGADKAWQLGDNGTFFTGLYAGYGRAKRDFDQGSSGDTDNIYGGVYGTWVHLSGWYVDMVAKVQNFDNSFEAIDGWGVTNNGSYKNWGYGVSVETGYPFAFGDKWFIEPIAQIAYTRITDADYSTDTGVRVGVDSADVLQARGMIRFGKVCQIGESILQPYVKVGIVGQTSSGGEVRGSGGSWSADTDGVRGEAGAGVTWLIDNANQIYVDYEASFGDAYTKPWAFNFGFRHQF